MQVQVLSRPVFLPIFLPFRVIPFHTDSTILSPSECRVKFQVAMSKERVYWVDQAKALGLFVVMLVHGPIPYWLEYYLRSFSMPRFFIIAGLFISLQQPLREFLRSKTSRLLLPYFFFSFVSYSLWLGFRNFSGSADAKVSPVVALMWIFYGNGGGNMVHNRPLWFLPALFSTLILVYVYSRIKKPYIYWVLCLSAVAGYFLMGALQPRPPWSLDLALTTSVLVMIGYLFRERILDSKPMRWGSLLFWTVISLLTAFGNTFLQLSSADVGNFFLFYLSAFAGSLVTLDITKRLPYNRFISFIGQNTLPLYAMHILVFMFLFEFFDVWLPGILSGYGLPDFARLEPLWFGMGKLSVFMAAGLGIPLMVLRCTEKIQAFLAGFASSPMAQQDAVSFALKTTAKQEALAREETIDEKARQSPHPWLGTLSRD